MSSSLYHYDAHGVLSRVETAEHDGLRFWSGGRVVNELRTRAGATSQLTWLRAEGVPLSELIGGSGARKSLLGSGPGGSVVLEADQAVRAVHYAAHGHRGSEGALTEPPSMAKCWMPSAAATCWEPGTTGRIPPSWDCSWHRIEQVRSAGGGSTP